jgi:MFS family permease
VWVLSGTIVGTITALYSWNRVISLYLRELGATDREIGWAYFCFTLAYRLPQILGGALTDRVGRKAIVVTGTFGMATGYALVAHVPRWEHVVLSICLVWVIGALQWPALAAMVAESVPERERGKALGLLEAGSMLGLTLGPLLGEQVCAARPLAEAWRLLLLGSMAVYALCGLARLAGLREVTAEEGSPPPARAPFPWSALVIPLGVTVLTFAAFFLTTDGPVLGLYIEDEAGGSPATVQTVGFYGGLAAMAGALAAGLLADRLGAGRTMLLTSLASAALLAPMAAGAFRPRSELVLFALLFIPGEAYVVAYQKLVTSVAPRSRGLSVGVVGSAVGLAASWAMVLGGDLYARGHRLPLVAAFAVQAAAAVLGLGLLRARYN